MSYGWLISERQLSSKSLPRSKVTSPRSCSGEPLSLLHSTRPPSRPAAHSIPFLDQFPSGHRFPLCLLLILCAPHRSEARNDVDEDRNESDHDADFLACVGFNDRELV